MVSGVVLLLALLVMGFFEAFVLKLKNTACVTWMTGIVALAFWIAYPMSTMRLCLGGVTFIVGLLLVITYYKHAEPSKP
jgi:hypothetical protein